MARAHGLTGEVVVDLVSNRPGRLGPGDELWAGDRRLQVVASRPDRARHLVRFAGVDDRQAADALRGAVLSALAPPAGEDPDVLWVHQLVGAEVVHVDGWVLGRVTAVEANPASDLLVLESGALVPLRFAVGGMAEGRLQVDTPPGLVEEQGRVMPPRAVPPETADSAPEGPPGPAGPPAPEG